MVACSPLAINRSAETCRSGLLIQACSINLLRGIPPSVSAQPDSERLDSMEVVLDSQCGGEDIPNGGFFWARGRLHPKNKKWLIPVKVRNMVLGFILLMKN